MSKPEIDTNYFDYQTHEEERKHEEAKDPIPIPFSIQTFPDLYRLVQLCLQSSFETYIDCQRLACLVPIITEIHHMVGLDHVKNALCDMILFHLQGHTSYYRHMLLTGPTGTGKTTVARLIAKLLHAMGHTNSPEITIANPLNLTFAPRGNLDYTTHVIRQAVARSGVLLIDEAPSVASAKASRPTNQPPAKSTMAYDKRCLDMLVQLMDEYRHCLVVIFAGYKYDIVHNILNVHPGMERRIKWVFDLKAFSPAELYEIFQKQLTGMNFHLDHTQTEFGLAWFETNYLYFPHYGGSIRSFTEAIQLVHTRKFFGAPKNTSIIQLHDQTIQEGFCMYVEHYCVHDDTLPDMTM